MKIDISLLRSITLCMRGGGREIDHVQWSVLGICLEQTCKR
jgi:hypothetical protein